jgi:large subunit ribosomal protein L13
MKTFSAKEKDVVKKWHVVDADGKVLGRLAAKIATVLTGKNKPIFTPHVDTGDFVIVLNAGKVRLTGRKPEQKRYWRYSGYPGGLHSRSFEEVRKAKPERIIREAVYGMLPKNRLAAPRMRKLKVYPGAEHPHEAQQPTVLEI